MYSVVLAAMLTAGSATPAWGCHGCHGCHGCSSCCGCCGGCYGCHGCSGCYGCHGCHGCYGCSTCYSCSGCCGGYWGCSGCSGCYACYGCYGCYGCYAVAAPMAHVYAAPPAAAPAKTAADTSASEAARVTVKLPEDAKLYVDGIPCPLKSSPRTFQTPKLEPGRTYAYTLKAEVTRDGRTLSETRQVTLRAGKPVTVEFGEMGSALTASR